MGGGGGEEEELTLRILENRVCLALGDDPF